MVSENGTSEEKLPLFRMSSQYQRWRFTKSELEKTRSDVNAAGVRRIKALIEEERNARKEQTESQSMVDNKDKEEGSSRESSQTNLDEIEFLTREQEQDLVILFLEKLSKLSSALKFTEAVEATAITYVKRFYLRNTCMDYHPKLVILTCLFLATKTEDQPISIDTFVSKINNTTNDDILSLEFPVSQSLQFQYKIHHAHLAAYGIFLDMIMEKLGNATDIHHAYASARQYLVIARYTDAEFLYTPSQVAVATFCIDYKHVVDPWIKSKCQKMGETALSKQLDLDINDLDGHINEIKQLILSQKARTISKDQINEISRRLKSCTNPEKDQNSALYKLRKVKAEKAQADRAKAKQTSSAKAGGLGDPFQ